MNIKVTLSHNDLVNLLCGRPGPCGDCQYSRFIGNQWNPDWEWDRDALRKLSEVELAKMYFGENFEYVL